MNTASRTYYDMICNTLGTEGNPSDLIGKYIEFHYEENQGFENLRIDREESEDELADYLYRVENGFIHDMWNDNNVGVQKKNIVHKHKRVSGTTTSETGTPKKKKRKVKPVTENLGDVADDLSDFD